MTNHSQMKLGKLPAIRDPRTLKLGNYLGPRLISDHGPTDDAAVFCDWTVKCKVPFGMMLNDRLGDCTIAACAHAVQVWTANRGAERTLSDKDIEWMYELWDGYVPGNPESDKGGFELDVLNRWRKESLYGAQMEAYAAVNPLDALECKRAIELFGGIYIGLQLPISAKTEDIWDVVTSADGLWGGHAVFVPTYDADGLTCITWGQKKRMTWAFLRRYCDEAYALMSPLWLDKDGVAANGFDYLKLEADLDGLRV